MYIKKEGEGVTGCICGATNVDGEHSVSNAKKHNGPEPHTTDLVYSIERSESQKCAVTSDQVGKVAKQVGQVKQHDDHEPF